PRCNTPSAGTPGPGCNALAHYNLGLAFRQKGYYNEALREYRLALERGEDRRLTLQAMAELHLLKHDFPAARARSGTLFGNAPTSGPTPRRPRAVRDAPPGGPRLAQAVERAGRRAAPGRPPR